MIYLLQTVNIVAEVANFLHTYTRDLIGSDLKQINQILQTLIEMCVGNPKNQQVIFDTVVIEPLNRLLELSNNVTHNQCTNEVRFVQFHYIHPYQHTIIIILLIVFMAVLCLSISSVTYKSQRKCCGTVGGNA